MTQPRIELHLGDCLEILPALESESVDAIITDPPYGSTACRWDVVIPLKLMWRELKRIVGPNNAIVLFSSQPFTSVLVTSNIKQFRCEWIWHKSVGGGFLNANRYPLKRHENILVFGKKMPIYNPQFTDGEPYERTRAAAGETTFDQTVAGWVTKSEGQRYPTTVQYVSSETGLHPTQKPVALMTYLVKTYTNPGDTILDFTMGSGTTGVACVQTGRNFIGIEIDPEYYRIAQERIGSTQLGLI